MAWVSMSRFGTYPPSTPVGVFTSYNTCHAFQHPLSAVPPSGLYLVGTLPIVAVGIQLVNTLRVLVSMLPWEVTSCQVALLPDSPG